MLLVYRITLQMSIIVIGGKLTKHIAVKGESKGILPAIAILVKRLQIRISLFLEMSAKRLIRGFCGSANKGLR